MAIKPKSSTSGRILMVDPNPDGNGTVNLEDLSIIVELDTESKSRSVVNIETGKVSSTTSKSGKTPVKFINGPVVGDNKNLTTNYTEANTTFNKKGHDLESLGITDIDISFNSSFAPMIKINFVDVRGNSVFERGNESDYRVFFDLPYPIFKLTIKGYYGKAVTYCLHLTKWNSLFNSDTGNYEITCEFVGYTYAILTDLLIGYLKGIGETTRGKAKLGKYKLPDGKGVSDGEGNIRIPTILELMQIIEKVNKEVNKLKKSNSDVKQLKLADTNAKNIEQVKDSLDSFLKSINPDGDGLEITDDKLRGIMVVPSSDIAILNKKIKTYKTNITKIINDTNEKLSEGFRLEVNEFTNVFKYLGVTRSSLGLYSNISDSDIVSVIARKDDRLLSLLTSKIPSTNPPKTPLNVIDLRKSYKELDRVKNKLEKLIIKQKESVSELIKLEIPKILGFKPTIANMLGIFTAHGEVFLDVIKEVAKAASNDSQRKYKLTSFNLSDMSEQTSKDSTGNPSGDMEGEIFPFPEFTNDDGIEVWVGDKVSIPETEFIEDLLRGMLDYSKSEEKILNLLNQDSQSWYPINPLDTEVGGSVGNPYLSVSNTENVDKILRLVGQRAAIFLGYSLSDYTFDELDIMATYEANNLYQTLEDDKIKDNFTNSFESGTDLYARLNNLNDGGVINENDDNSKGVMFSEPSLNGNAGYVSYSYIHKTDRINNASGKAVDRPKSYINISEPFDGNDFLIDKSVAKQTFVSGVGKGVYISNYANDAPVDEKLNIIDDGATYVTLMDFETFSNNTNGVPQLLEPDKLLPKTVETYYETAAPTMTEDFLDNDKLETTVLRTGSPGIRKNYNQFEGTWFTQQFTELADIDVIGGDNIDGDIMLMFYGEPDFNISNNSFKLGLSLPRKTLGDGDLNNGAEDYALERKVTTITNNVTTNTITTGKTFKNMMGDGSVNYIRNELVALSERYAIDTLWGENRRFISDMIDGEREIVFPIISYEAQKFGQGLSTIPLFGSNLYFEQESEEARALLFLHAMPFYGMETTPAFSDGGLFSNDEIKNLFKKRAGFIKAPKPWILFVGGLLWRHAATTDPIKFIHSGKSLIAGFDNSATSPTQSEYLKASETNSKPLSFRSGDYISIEPMLLNLPTQVKELFIREFETWVRSDLNTGWITIKDGLELFNFDGFTTKGAARTAWHKLYTDFLSTTPLTNYAALKAHTDASGKINTIKDIDNFRIINKITTAPARSDDTTYHNNIYVEHKEGTKSMLSLLDFLVEPKVILNSTWRIWDDNNSGTNEGTGTFKATGTEIEVNELDLKRYLGNFQREIDRLNAADLKTREKQNDSIKSDLFNSIDNDKIKLNLYRNVKAIYDKWVAGTTDVLAHCGGGNISGTESADILNTGGKLINSFHFLTKSFIDIGDTFFINPLGVIGNISGNFNQSLYDLVGRTLSDNNFNFNPLPSFINFKEQKEMEDMFKPFPYSKAISASTVGPSFVCTYIGDRSKHLDLGENATYPNDGFDFKSDGKGGVTVPAKSYNENKSGNEMSIPVFAVNYGDQNQSIFKNIKLNQQEYSETDESLHIMDDISKGGSPNSKTYMGQNMFNVYSTRSYSAEIEMLGNATIQPMMYFQLNSIPMFHGAFLITSVRHKIKPNHMTTTVTGVRVRQQDVPLIDEKTVYMNFVDITEGVKTDGISLSQTVGIPEWNYNANVTNIIKS